MSTIVCDASVILKWFRSKDEKKIQEARAYLEDHLNGSINIAIPELLYYEIGNVLATKPDSTKEDVLEALNILDQLNLQRFSITSVLQKRGLELVFSYAISFYDASYVALAQELKVEMITADEKLAKRLSLPFIAHL